MYVIYVMLGREDDIMRHLRETGYAAYVPKRILIQRKNGVYYSIPQILFPSYVFIDVKKISPEAYYKIRSVNGVGYFLSRDDPLPEAEAAYIKELCKNDEIGISKGELSRAKAKRQPLNEYVEYRKGALRLLCRSDLFGAGGNRRR